jgi:dATP/dGTP diphosphohydrolase
MIDPEERKALQAMAADITQRLMPPVAAPLQTHDMRYPHGFASPIPGIIHKQPPEPTPLVSESTRRKATPLFQGCFMYFPDALKAIAEHSKKGNDKHNPGQPLHWSKEKSKDHADCIGRHLLDIGPDWGAVDPEFDSLHATALAWRALALLQTVLERRKAIKQAE